MTLPTPETKNARVSTKVLKHKLELPEVVAFVLFSFEIFEIVHLRLLDF
jgi:hypothetical protein